MDKNPSVAVRMPSDSMEPTLPKGSVLLGRFGFEFERWDVIGFRHYLNAEEFEMLKALRGQAGKGPHYDEVRAVMGPPHGEFVSRVVGLAGETIVVDNDGVFIDSKLISPPPRLPGLSRLIKFDEGLSRFARKPYQIPDGCVFVLNDNRARVTDSRLHGPIKIGQIMGKMITTTDFAALGPDVKSDMEWFAGNIVERPGW
jgi:signal peptidase I